MKMIVENKDAEGLEALLGEIVTIYCACYIYTGRLVGVNTTCVKLEDAAIVYDTGPHENAKWADVKKMPNGVWYVQTGMIESFGIFKKE